jgi:glyoxylase-like metal-dependent hydrolase (beta-lactamase superfamily II)
MDVGSVRIDPVADGVMRARASEILSRPGVADPWAAYTDLLNADGELELALGGFLIRSGDRLVLVDAGLGPTRGETYHAGALLDSLAALGVTTEEVTDVVLTHLHYDHVGWVTQKGRIVFPGAVYRCHESDWRHFVSAPDAAPGAVRKLGPLADRLEMFTADGPVAPGINVRAAPGHTPGSTIVIVSSGQHRAILLGDVVHCPIELTEPDWQTVFDVDPTLAQRTRQALAREIEGSDVPVTAAHFPGLRFGRLLRGSGASQWTFG